MEQYRADFIAKFMILLVTNLDEILSLLVLYFFPKTVPAFSKPQARDLLSVGTMVLSSNPSNFVIA